MEQGCELRRLAFYFDVEAELWRGVDDWAALDARGWDERFQPGIAAVSDSGAHL